MPDKEEGAVLRKRLNFCGVHIKQLRLAQGLSVADVQAALQQQGVSPHDLNIEQVEAGTCEVYDYDLIIFSELFGVQIEQLIWGGERPSLSPDQFREMLNKEVDGP